MKNTLSTVALYMAVLLIGVSAALAYKSGEKVDVEWNGAWYPAIVKEVKGSQYFIHYECVDNNGTIRKDGSIVGEFDSSGTLRKNGSIIGDIDSGGTIRKNGMIWGDASGGNSDRDRRAICAVVVFFSYEFGY